MIKAFFEGTLLGLTLAILIGPSFFALIQTSIKRGFKSALALAFGIFISDVICVLLAYLGASQLFSNPENKLILGIAGGCILIGFGLHSVFQKHPEEAKGIEIKNVNVPLLVVKGFFMNIINPFVFLFWVGVVGLVASKHEFAKSEIIMFFTGTLFIVLATDIFKAYIALKIKNLLKSHLLVYIHRVAGGILIIFGLILIYRVIF